MYFMKQKGESVMINHLTKRMTYTQIIALSFLCVIGIGTVLLCLPVSSAGDRPADVLTALFTATSATCVTGLSLVNTGVYWSMFGQVVILLLIQIGGIGFMTLITMFSVFMKQRISLRERQLMMVTSGNMRLDGIRPLFRRILFGTLFFEGIGAALLAIRFCGQFGPTKGIWFAVFHSVSAFCNAGFDVLGDVGLVSLTSYYGDPLVILTVCALIIIGGIGFFVWSDLLKCRGRWKLMQLHSKIALSTTALLILLGWVLFNLFERNAAFAGMDTGERLLASLFQSVTPRTAGFNSVDQAALSNSGSMLTILFMFIGGSPCSTAGGFKTVTFAVLVVSTVYSARNERDTIIFCRRLHASTVRQASAIATFYLFAVIGCTLTICAIEPFGLREVLFEVTSAIGTTGLSMGITASLGSASKLILILLMYAGRIGGLSLFLVLAEKRVQPPVSRPAENILIG